MIISPTQLRIMATGFWLPCNQSSFFQAKDKRLVTGINNHLLEKPLTNELQTTVFQRLMTVLYHKHYTHVYPIIPSNHLHASPEAVIFAASVPAVATADRDPIVWSAVSPPIHSLICIVNAHGFYLWLAVYAVGANDGQDSEQVKQGLKAHIDNIVGQTYFSHYSGLKDDADKVVNTQEREENLNYYREKLIGILTFSQINTILEGLYNSSLDPRVFFGESDSGKVDVDAVKRDYSLGSFIDLILTPAMPLADFQLSEPGEKEEKDENARKKPLDERRVIQNCRALLSAIPLREIGSGKTSHVEVAQELAHSLLNERLYSQLLRQFLRGTSDETLQNMKHRIERCRRALLSEMIEITHRRFPLLQAEPPDPLADRIEGVNESQLRGYVMLFAAKLPLIETVHLHLADIMDEYFPNRRDRKDFPYHSWELLLKAIENDVQRLEDAINQASMDRQLNEEEQIRSTEETLAEIERLRSRTEESQSLVSTLTTAGLSNFIAFLGLFLAFHSLSPGLDIPSIFTKPLIPILPFQGVFGQIVSLVVLIIIAVMVYLLIQGVTAQLIRSGRSSLRQRRNKDDRFYYEFDLHIQAPLANDRAEQLLNGDFYQPPASPKKDTPVESSLSQPGVPLPIEVQHYLQQQQAEERQQIVAVYRAKTKLIFTKPSRNSYRIEREGKDAAIHKVYIETDVSLVNRRWRAGQWVHVILVYEVAFHRPTLNHSYILQDLRVVINHGTIFSPAKLEKLKDIIAEYFVNHWLDNPWHVDKSPSVDAFFSLNITSEDLSTQPTGETDGRLARFLERFAGRSKSRIRRNLERRKITVVDPAA